MASTDLFRATADIARVHAAAVTGRYRDIEPAGDPSHPMSPDYRNADEARLEAIRGEILERDDDIAGIAMSDDAASSVLQQVIVDVLRHRPISDQLARDLRRAVLTAVDAEAGERLEREKAARSCPPQGRHGQARAPGMGRQASEQQREQPMNAEQTQKPPVDTYLDAVLSTQSVLSLLELDIPPAQRSGRYWNARRHLLVAVRELQDERAQLIEQAGAAEVGA